MTLPLAARLLATLLCSATLVCAGMATAGPEEDMQAYYQASIQPWQEAPPLIAAIRAQNARTAGYDADRIETLDRAWREQIGATDRPMIDTVTRSDAADFLRKQAADSKGHIVEAFVTDARGLNVAATGVTSDYWQGDEAKFTETFPKGPKAIHIGDIDFDESTQTYLGQISSVIVDPDSGEPIGTLTVGLNADALH